MNHRRLGRTGLEVSEVGYGAWGIGGSGWLGAQDDESLRALELALDSGINLIDTALGYGDGHSEELVGEAVRSRSETVYVATKIPPKNRLWPARAGTHADEAFPADHVRACTEQSLRNLGLEAIDVQQFHVWDDAKTGRWSRPPAFPGGGGGLVSTIDDYHTYFRMLLNHGVHDGERILSRPAVELMTTNRLTPEQNAARTAMARDNVHVSFGQGQHGGWGFGMAVRTYRGDYAPIGQFGWDGGSGASTYADPHNDLVGILLTQVGTSAPNSAHAFHDFWTTLYQAIDN